MKVLRHRTDLIVPICCVTFAVGGAVEDMWEEVIPLVPVLLLLVRSARYDPITAVAMSIGSAAVGIAFGPINPFSVGIAQKVAQLPLLSGLEFRMAVLIAGLAIWMWWTMRHAKRTRTTPELISPETAAGPRDARGPAGVPSRARQRGAVGADVQHCRTRTSAREWGIRGHTVARRLLR